MFYQVDVWTYAVIILIRWNLDAHFDNCVQEFREAVEKVRDHMYADELVTVGENMNVVQKLKSDSIILFRQGGSLSYISGILAKQY